MYSSPSSAARTGLVVALALAATAGCDRAGETPLAPTAPPRAAPSPVPPANPLLGILQRQLADPWSARGWRTSLLASPPELLDDTDAFLARLRGDASAGQVRSQSAAFDYESGEVTQEDADAAVGGWLFIYPETGVVGGTVTSTLTAGSFWIDMSFVWKYERFDGSVVVRTPGDSPHRCQGPGGTSFTCQITSNSFKCTSEIKRIGGNVIAHFGAIYFPFVESVKLIGPKEQWRDCPPPPPPGTPTSGGGYTEECLVCTQWFYFWADGTVQEWWECEMKSDPDCGLMS